MGSLSGNTLRAAREGFSSAAIDAFDEQWVPQMHLLQALQYELLVLSDLHYNPLPQRKKIHQEGVEKGTLMFRLCIVCLVGILCAQYLQLLR
jgi:hypothetical protein